MELLPAFLVGEPPCPHDTSDNAQVRLDQELPGYFLWGLFGCVPQTLMCCKLSPQIPALVGFGDGAMMVLVATGCT
jgi:hypothetical protein